MVPLRIRPRAACSPTLRTYRYARAPNGAVSVEAAVLENTFNVHTSTLVEVWAQGVLFGRGPAPAGGRAPDEDEEEVDPEW